MDKRKLMARKREGVIRSDMDVNREHKYYFSVWRTRKEKFD